MWIAFCDVPNGFWSQRPRAPGASPAIRCPMLSGFVPPRSTFDDPRGQISATMKTMMQKPMIAAINTVEAYPEEPSCQTPCSDGGSVWRQTYLWWFDMEAAMSIQLEALPRRAVEVRDGVVTIDGLAVHDRTLAELVERGIERDVAPEQTVTDAIEIGARVLDREATTAEVDFVSGEFERVSNEVERTFTERAREVADRLQEQLEQFLGQDSGSMAKTLDRHSEGLSELIAQHFGGDRSTAVQHQIRELTSKLLSDSRQDLLRQFSAEDGHNPLADFKAAVVREVNRSGKSQEKLIEKLVQLEGEIKRLHDAREAEAELSAERERGTIKGRAYEQRVFELVEEMALARGDVARHVGDERSAAGGKHGDIVIEIDAASGQSKGRIALDAKDEKLSKNKAWESLNAALDERDAGFAILVTASDAKVPSGREPLHEYEGNKMIVTLDKESFDTRALELAYRYARCRCLMAGESNLELSAPRVRDAAEEALSALKEAQRVRASLTGAANGVHSAREALDAMVGRVQAALERVEALVAPR